VSLALDERQRAMLEEMGVRVFAPRADSLEHHAGATDGTSLQQPRPQVSAPPAQYAGPADGARPDPHRQAGGSADLRPAVREAVPLRESAVAAEAPLRQRIPGVAGMEWEALAQAVAECRACRLCEGRTNTVFGVGDLRADWMVIGEAPGENEDLQGEPFVGQAGKLLDNMLAALGIRRGNGVYIANVLKCRPPGNRNPLPEEIAQCEPFLRRQVELLRPKIILAMGRFAVHTLLQTTEPVGKLRGRVHRYHDVPLVVTYHPAYLLRNLPDKAKAWADLCLAQEVMRQGV
jgi:uracil-DNA glycosylase family 4